MIFCTSFFGGGICVFANQPTMYSFFQCISAINRTLQKIYFVLHAEFFDILIFKLFFFTQEYERAVIFRLGRLLKSGARGPGVFFIIPCIDHYEKIDMRTQTYDVPPQEVNTSQLIKISIDNKCIMKSAMKSATATLFSDFVTDPVQPGLFYIHLCD